MSDKDKDENKRPPEPRPEGEDKATFEKARAQDQHLQQLHTQLMREKQEPSERFLPMPLFLVLLIAGLSFWAGIYLIKYSGGFDPMVYDENLMPGEAVDTGPAEFDPMAFGARFYQNNCQVCHQANGQGVPGQFPPVAESDWVQGDPERLVKILLHGMMGPIVVNGNNYNGVMPAFGNQSDRNIAAVLTWMRTTPDFGNNAEPIEPEFVAEVREATSGQTSPYDGPTLMEQYGVQ